jgi:TonB family protein
MKMFAIPIAILSGALLAAQDSKPLPAPVSSGQAIQDSAQATVPVPAKYGNIEILSDTQGVDFGPYLKDVVSKVRTNWYELIPTSAEMRKGKVAIEFAILKDGHIGSMKLVATSGDVALDRAAWGGITASNPLPTLPSAFPRPYLALRLRFYYNPEKADLDKAGTSTMTGSGGSVADVVPVVHATIPQRVVDANLPRYPKHARADKDEGVVRLVAQIAPDGAVESVAAVEGSLALGAAASQAIRRWRFEPARQNGQPVEDRVRIRFEFRLSPELIKAEVLEPGASATAAAP